MPADQLSNNYQQQNVFLKGQQFISATYTNSTGSTVNLTVGQVMGRILATQKVLPTVAAATDGSEMPRFICGDNYTVANGASVTVQLCWKGDINQNAITWNGAEGLDTVVRTVSTGGGTLGDLLRANSELVLYPSLELSGYDN